MSALELEGLTKHYGDTVAVDGLTMSIEAGEVFGFLGPNGSGKTTTIRLLLGLLRPTAGSARVLGASIDDETALVEAKRDLGYLPDELGVPEKVTGRAILSHHASIKGDDRLDALLEELFSPPLDRQVRTYSAGNRQMLGILLAFMHDPSVVILDEPTSGLDPLKQARFHEFLRRERDRGTTVFFSSHVLSEVRRVCDRVGILRAGRLAELEAIDTMLRRGGKRVLVAVEGDIDLEDWPDVHGIERVGDAYQFTYTGEYTALLTRLAAHEVIEVSIEEPPLEDVFMHYYGDDLDA